MNSDVHAQFRPLKEKLVDYKDEIIADSFPLLFPFGYTGLSVDEAIQKYNKENEKSPIIRKRKDVFRGYLLHQKPAMHEPIFNLILSNLLMKETIFQQTQIRCNIRSWDDTQMGTKYGKMTGPQLLQAISDSRNHLAAQFSNKAENQFLQSIHTVCGKLPHSNEAALEARRIYFSFLMKFGLPAIFLTVTPDDTRNFRIVLYSLTGKEKAKPFYNVDDFTDSDIVNKFKIRQHSRLNYPGLCAEEYERIIKLIIKHFFNWNTETKSRNGIGLFGEVEAWCLATEEQARKTLHGHFLLFIKDWSKIWPVLQTKKEQDKISKRQYDQAAKESIHYFDNICSAQLFSDFEQNKPLSNGPVFSHNECTTKHLRNGYQTFYNIVPVSDQTIRNMRNKQLCDKLGGIIASCSKCKQTFAINDIVTTALNTHICGSIYDPNEMNGKITFPEEAVKRLDWYIYEIQKDLDWFNDSDEKKRH
jgi:hypothetical protein